MQLREATKRSISRNAREVSPRLATIAMYFSPEESQIERPGRPRGRPGYRSIARLLSGA